MKATVYDVIEEGGHYLDQDSTLILWKLSVTMGKLVFAEKDIMHRHFFSSKLNTYWTKRTFEEGKVVEFK